MVYERAGRLAQSSDLVGAVELVITYYIKHPNPNNLDQKVVFGTSGHHGLSPDGAFNEGHIHATTQTTVDYRKGQGIGSPFYAGRDTRGLSEPAMISVLEVLTVNGVTVMVDTQDRYTPTPTISHTILTCNCNVEGGSTGSSSARTGDIVIISSHNPPRDGGFKYNPPTGGPTDMDATDWIAARANEYLAKSLDGVKRQLVDRTGDLVVKHDYPSAYVSDLPGAVNLDAIRDASVRIGADPMGGASMDYWSAIGNVHSLSLTVVNPSVDVTWRFMTLDTDSKTRMDYSSPNAMASPTGNRDKFDISIGNDVDSDRHGVATPGAGLMNPNHYLAAAVDYLFTHRPDWSQEIAVGKTLVSSSMIDHVVTNLGHKLVEVPTGFKWLASGLPGGIIGLGGEESVGASLLRHSDTVRSTDKDGIILDLLVSEIKAMTEKIPSRLYIELADKYDAPVYARIDADVTREQEAILKKLSPEQIRADTLTGETITAKSTEAPGNGVVIGSLKVAMENAWFTVRPSGAEDRCKIYAEPFRGVDHLVQVQAKTQDVVLTVLNR